MKNIRAIALATIVASACYALSATANQPHMDNALAALQTARAELQAASANKGGHRVKAIELIDQAISETKEGMAAADLH